MDRSEKLCFAQFLHPGGEHQPDDGDLKRWNRGPHRRKFVRIPGRCIRDDESHRGPLVCWTEWEADSTVRERIARPLRHGPQVVYDPYYSRPRKYDGLQNTDPFIFGGFFYTGCQQYTSRGPTQLRDLARGSVILFGSCIDRRHFVVDTVFVVDRHIDHSAATWRKRVAENVTEGYIDVTLRAWYQASGGCRKKCVPDRREFRLYFGATVHRPVNGMFSFFPCQPYEEGTRGFARPRIHIRGVVKDTLLQGKRLNPQPGLANTARLWNTVARQVQAQGLWLGVHATMPPSR